MTETMTSQNIDLSFWDTLYIVLLRVQGLRCGFLNCLFWLPAPMFETQESKILKKMWTDIARQKRTSFPKKSVLFSHNFSNIAFPTTLMLCYRELMNHTRNFHTLTMFHIWSQMVFGNVNYKQFHLWCSPRFKRDSCDVGIVMNFDLVRKCCLIYYFCFQLL
jgi:hypothetical protein